jgi:hypothetical protein
MTRLPVYCCCDPTLFLGTIDWPASPFAGQRRQFALQLPVPFDPQTEAITKQHAEVELEVGRHYLRSTGLPQLAVRSNDVPIEDLVLIPGFRIAKGNEF